MRGRGIAVTHTFHDSDPRELKGGHGLGLSALEKAWTGRAQPLVNIDSMERGQCGF